MKQEIRKYLYKSGYAIGSRLHLGRFSTVKKLRQMLVDSSHPILINGYPMYIDRYDSSELFTGKEYDPKATKLIESLLSKDKICLDMGANIGIYTILMGYRCKSVYAFEPSPEPYTVLRRNVELNKLGNVIIENAAISDKDKITSFYASKHFSLSSSFVELEDAQKIEIRNVRLDDYFKDRPRPDLIKMDIEGWEHEAILGGKSTFAHAKHIIFENHPEVLAKRKLSQNLVPQQLEDMGFVLRQIDDRNWYAHR